MDRSTNPEDYQYVARPVSILAKDYPHKFIIPVHNHIRDQLVYACSGAMRVNVGKEMWIVPPSRAVYIPAGLDHSVEMRSDVEMRTLYIEAGYFNGLPDKTIIFEVSELLRVLILNFLAEKIEYNEQSRGGDIVRLIVSELLNANTCNNLSVFMPNDERIISVCEKLIKQPDRKETLEEWSYKVGLSARTLARLFLKETGLRFSEWRLRVRMQYAMEALVRGEATKLVAHRCGYSSSSAFTYSFRHFYGITPGVIGSHNKLS